MMAKGNSKTGNSRDMSIWGKVLGGTAGFMMGGPIGAMLGGLAGHAVDRLRAQVLDDGDTAQSDDREDSPRQISFTIGIIVLGAKMAKADGVVTRDEIEAFKQVFKISANDMKQVGRLFDRARRDATGFEPYAKQIAEIFHDDKAVLEELLGGLFHIARADGTVTEDELTYLETVARIFGFSPQDWARIKAPNLPPNAQDPYQILGVAPDATDTEVKAAHRKLALENHPDRLMARGLPQEFLDLANEKLAAVNAAWDDIKKQRGLN